MKSEQIYLHIPIIDRLVNRLDNESINEPVLNQYATVKKLRRLVIQDLEILFNTRIPFIKSLADYPELNKSIFVFGLNDYTGKNPASENVRLQLKKDIKNAVILFEPRLQNVEIQLDDNSDNKQNIRFTIHARLVIEPVDEPIIFNTYFDSIKQKFVIAE